MEIEGLDLMTAKSSAVTSAGTLRQELIDGVSFRPTRAVAHDDGTLAEILRADWPEVRHGWKVLGAEEAFLINMPTSAYDHESPDALDLPYESAEAARIVPFRW